MTPENKIIEMIPENKILILEKNVRDLQEQLCNAYKKITSLLEYINNLEKKYNG